MHVIVIAFKAINVALIEDKKDKATAALVYSYVYQPIGKVVVTGIKFELIALARFANAK